MAGSLRNPQRRSTRVEGRGRPFDSTTGTRDRDGAATGLLATRCGSDVDADDAAVSGIETVVAGDAGIELEVGRRPASIGERENGSVAANSACDGARGWAGRLRRVRAGRSPCRPRVPRPRRSGRPGVLDDGAFSWGRRLWHDAFRVLFAAQCAFRER